LGIQRPLQANSGRRPREKVTILRKKFSPPASPATSLADALYPKSRRESGHARSAVPCHFRTHAVQQMNPTLSPRRRGQQRRRHFEAQCPRRREVDDKLEFGRLIGRDTLRVSVVLHNRVMTKSASRAARIIQMLMRIRAMHCIKTSAMLGRPSCPGTAGSS
jgi:hypothetical protein